ncbi:PolC-type DNA polymerase III [Leptolyngbya sp. PCC 6406]|uniref:3'-5' exonuclease n=1 Tax=Leptolyngbya sp. PCC 6406 TaxID=1173264 RepID=UPI0002AD1BA6|nr:3'-5' exonuclease [Leptolyngbya sp. PCC 6406]
MGRPIPRQGQAALRSTELLDYYRRVSQGLLTVVDVETTGSLPYRGARVVEVSILQATLAEGILHQETHLINPGQRIPANITRLTGITPAMVAQGSFPEEVWPDCLERLEQGTLTAHNLEFDYGFLQAEYRHLDHRFIRPPAQLFCTVLLSRLLLADLPSRRLPDLVQHFQFDVGRSHRAEADTRACWFLAEYLLRQIQQQPDAVLLDYFAQQWIPLSAAAAILQKSETATQQFLTMAGIESHFSKRKSRPLYRRGDVERIGQGLDSDQLSLF